MRRKKYNSAAKLPDPRKLKLSEMGIVIGNDILELDVFLMSMMLCCVITHGFYIKVLKSLYFLKLLLFNTFVIQEIR